MILNKIASKITLSIVSLISVLGLVGGHVSARTQYNSNGTSTTTTPVFNEFFGVPDGVGDEADFVRVKPKTGTNADYISTLNAACNVGDVYTVRTYVHNGADPSQNGNGSGTAVAHNVIVSMVAPFGNTSKDFTFTSNVTANNAESVSDTGKLACANDVVLKLVPKSVQTYSKPLGFITEADSAVNGSLKIGSQVHGSGDVWGCWEDRVIVVYDVSVEKKPEEPKKLPATCDVLKATISGRTVSINELKYTANDAKVTSVEVNFGDGKAAQTVDTTKLPFKYTYDKDGTFTVQATLKTDKGDIKVDSCKAVVISSTSKVVVTTTTLPKTGPGDVAGMFAALTIAGAVAHKYIWARYSRSV